MIVGPVEKIIAVYVQAVMIAIVEIDSSGLGGGDGLVVGGIEVLHGDAGIAAHEASAILADGPVIETERVLESEALAVGVIGHAD